MTDELTIADKTYVSSKRASEVSGYTQDYIGQLSRGAFIDAQRIGGLWYVNMDSLTSYKQKADQFKPQPPKYEPQAADPESLINFDGKDYVSAARGSKVTGYNQDYIGQLARSGKIMSRQVGNRWYIEREGLLAHKEEKDALLGAVQTESVGIKQPAIMQNEPVIRAYNEEDAGPQLTYIQENGDLMPVMGEKVGNEEPSDAETPAQSEDVHESRATTIPIRIQSSNTSIISPVQMPLMQRETPKTASRGGMGATKALVALTIVIMLSYGFISLKKGSVYTVTDVRASMNTASAVQALNMLGDVLEKLLTAELVYKRQ